MTTDNQLISFRITCDPSAVAGKVVLVTAHSYMPDPLTDETLKYSNPVYTSSNPEVAEITPFVDNPKYCNVVTKKAGNVTITATIGTVSANTQLTVMADMTQDTVVVNTAPEKVRENSTAAISSTHTGPDRKYKIVSSDPSVVAVSSNNLIVANRPGFAYIEAIGEKIDSDRKYIEVLPLGSLIDFSIKMTPSSTVLGGSLQATIDNVKVSDGYEYEVDSVTWTTSDASVATVSDTGKVTAKGVGTCSISATLDNVVRSVDVKVSAPRVADFTLSTSSDKVGHVTNCKASVSDVTPVGAVAAITYESSNEEIARVSSDGVVTPISEGVFTLTARDANTQISKSKNITVDFSDRPSPPKVPTGIDVLVSGDKVTSLSVEEGMSLRFTAAPADHQFVYSVNANSSDQSVATVTKLELGDSYEFEIIAGQIGTATITVYSGDVINRLPITVS